MRSLSNTRPTRALGGGERAYHQHAERCPDPTTSSSSATECDEKPDEQWLNVPLEVRLTVAREVLQGACVDICGVVRG